MKTTSEELFTFDEKTHVYKYDGVILPSVTEVLKTMGFIDYQFAKEWHMERGRAVHNATALFDRCVLNPDSVSPEVQPYLDAWMHFKMDSDFKPHMIEEKMFSEIYGFAGTPDRVGELSGRRVLLDIKCNQVPEWTAIQLGAYKKLLPPMVIDRYGVELRKDGKYRLVPFNDPSDGDVFLGVLAGYQWRKNHE